MIAEAQNGRIVCRTATVSGWSKECGTYATAYLVNELAADGAACAAVDALVITPPARRVKLHVIRKKLQEVCEERNIELKRIVRQEDASVSQPVIIVTAIGKLPAENIFQGHKTCPGQQIVLTKWVGMSGMLRAVEERMNDMTRRFSPVFIRQMLSYKKELFASYEAEIAARMGALAPRQVGDGGIYAALWNLSLETGLGLDLDLKHMSILQETIEVCEYFRLNPYQLYSAGCYLIVADGGERLAGELNAAGIKASVIGSLTDSNDKIIRNGGEIRYIDRPAPDEIGKIGARI